MDKKKWDLWALASIPLLMTLGNSMLIPVLPLMEKEIGITSFQSSLIITIYSVVTIPLIPVAGYLSDRLGRKKVMVPCLLIVAVGGVIASYAAWQMSEPYLFILIGRFIQGIGASGAFPVVMPMVGDLYESEEEVSKGLGIIETANTFGKVLSPVLGAFLAVALWYLPFVAIPVLALIAVLLIVFLVSVPKEDQEEEKQSFRAFLKKVKELLKQDARWLTGVFLAGGILIFVLFAFLFHFSSLLEDEFNKTGYVKGLWLAVPLLFLCIASYVSGSKIGSDQKRMKILLLIGSLLTAGAFFFIRESGGLIHYTTWLSIGGVGIGIALPCLDAFITEGIPKEERGTITSLYSSMRFIGVALGPPIAALMMKHLPNYIYVTFAVLVALVLVFTFFLINPPSKEST
ncbi:MFS transporter [Pontibacillus halophilus JSM 076056 = DSM 19796]|uniref:MFS transporter n=1 Tax=Pontibacillus halophilus JSM 076056 = DSM 19796 TaxID=1385510 RepID=A0A0A5GEU5_9BACI|nr:MFS transporter [Pontibacillus halophilus]KGX89743.1 MFS transporter [Pontibacillus halophilus JSM 076056 = DSM 19796]